MLPYVILHTGVSVDGRIDWGTGEMGPYYMLVERLGADADLSGSVTVLKANMPEDPRSAFPGLYDAWIDRPNRPLLAVVDSRGQVKNWRVIKRQPFWRGFVVLCSRTTPQSHLDYLREEGIETIVTGAASRASAPLDAGGAASRASAPLDAGGAERVDLRLALEELNERCGVKVVRVDSGGILNGALLRAGLVSEVSVVVYPCLVGGTSPQTMFVAEDLDSQAGVIHAALTHVEAIEDKYVWMRYKVVK